MEALIELKSKQHIIRLEGELYLTVTGKDGAPVWTSSTSHTPSVSIRAKGRVISLPLSSAGAGKVEAWSDGDYKGKAVRLAGFAGTDAEVQIGLALGPEDELLVQVDQVAGEDEVVSVERLFRFEKSVDAGGYMVLPHRRHLVGLRCVG